MPQKLDRRMVLFLSDDLFLFLAEPSKLLPLAFKAFEASSLSPLKPSKLLKPSLLQFGAKSPSFSPFEVFEALPPLRPRLRSFRSLSNLGSMQIRTPLQSEFNPGLT